jgi:hypothetical protein
MRLMHALFFMSLTACASIGNSAVRVIEHAFDRVATFTSELLDLFSPEPPIIATAGWGGGQSVTGQALDPAMLQRLRHESAVGRRSADRHN